MQSHRAFGAEEMVSMVDGERIGHAELKIGDSAIMLAEDVSPEEMQRRDQTAG